MSGVVAVAVPVPNSPIFQSLTIMSPLLCRSPGVHGAQSRSPVAMFQPQASPLPFRVNETKRIIETSDVSNSEGGGSALLKRKRPPRINLPVVVAGEIGPFALETPRREEERVEVIEVEGDGYSLYSKRGRRSRFMEDRYSVFVDTDQDSKHVQAFFGVFDGHGGGKAAEYASQNLEKNVISQLSSSRCQEGLEMAVRNGYLTTDAEFLQENALGGTCCVTALIHQGNLVVSNAGDCRAVMSRGGVAEVLTSDHRASRPDEKDRIEASGGYVDCCNGVWRIQGSLAVTRGIGDRHLKKWVIAEPETEVFQIKPEYEFLILASDGLWDKVGNQEAVDIVHSLCVNVDNPQPFSACKKLTELSSKRGSIDDITVMVIQLSRFAT